MVNVLPRYNFWVRGLLTFDYFENVSVEGSTSLSQNPEGNTAVAISDVTDTRWRFHKNGQRIYGYALEHSFLREQVDARIVTRDKICTTAS